MKILNTETIARAANLATKNELSLLKKEAKEDINQVEGKVGSFAATTNQKLDKIHSRLDRLEEAAKHMATKEDLGELRKEMATELNELRKEMATKKDISQLQKNFDELQTNFDKLQTNFHQIQREFSRVEERLEHMATKEDLGRLEEKVNRLCKMEEKVNRLCKMEEKVDWLCKMMEKMDYLIGNLPQQVPKQAPKQAMDRSA